ncbi:hypothetical protein CWC29_023195 [Pseudoalteromonas sp. S4498]|uniref:hypothetical protein n=1 Tax=Pseudoalteromonas galatheae TaxID=579562 RepID=UPI001109B4D8|nr:hypothetical protein [Pseudoalteromonas galatheae]NKC21687.1 hypothetical protein [Pseudoalteromonas galatheae]
MQIEEWKEPWRAIQFAAEIPHVQKQYQREITKKHPLFGKNGKVIGRRIDCDDVVVVLSDGTYVNVHLVWGTGASQFPEDYPSWFTYGSKEDFLNSMAEDSSDYED